MTVTQAEAYTILFPLLLQIARVAWFRVLSTAVQKTPAIVRNPLTAPKVSIKLKRHLSLEFTDGDTRVDLTAANVLCVFNCPK